MRGVAEASPTRCAGPTLVRAHYSFNLIKTRQPCKDPGGEHPREKHIKCKGPGAGLHWSARGAAKRLEGLRLSGCWVNRRRGRGRSEQGWDVQALG